MDEKQTSQLFELAGLILAVGRHIQASKEAAAESELSHIDDVSIELS
ncbi:hypothetical protein ACFXPY_43355 [Streptomyces sp. NPDC059153]